MNISKINTQNCIRSNIAFQIETKPSFVSQTEDINSFYNTNLLTDSIYSKNKYHKQIIVSSKDIDYLNKIKKEYSKKFYILTNGYTKPATINIGKDILKLFNQYNKEVLKYAEQNHINYISSENLSINELRKFINFIDLIIPPNTTKKKYLL